MLIARHTKYIAISRIELLSHSISEKAIATFQGFFLQIHLIEAIHIWVYLIGIIYDVCLTNFSCMVPK